jgi:hypothetical protein
MTIETTVHLNEQQLELLARLVEDHIYELRYEVEQGQTGSDHWLEVLKRHYSLLKSGKEQLISWNSIIGGAYPQPIEPSGWEQWLLKRGKP